jgi:hypothetical protein
MSSLDVVWQTGPPRILDFDIENRPLSYLGQDFTTAEITAIAASFGPDAPVQCWLQDLLTPVPDAYEASALAMLKGFRAMYDQADIVTGHYILRHDLPIINGAMLEYGLPSLGPKLVSDTKVHLRRSQGVSKSQENLAALYETSHPKVGMSQKSWRAANRGFAPDLVRERVIGDVRQHQELRLALIKTGMLGPPKMWRP